MNKTKTCLFFSLFYFFISSSTDNDLQSRTKNIPGITVLLKFSLSSIFAVSTCAKQHHLELCYIVRDKSIIYIVFVFHKISAYVRHCSV